MVSPALSYYSLSKFVTFRCSIYGEQKHHIFIRLWHVWVLYYNIWKAYIFCYCLLIKAILHSISLVFCKKINVMMNMLEWAINLIKYKKVRNHFKARLLRYVKLNSIQLMQNEWINCLSFWSFLFFIWPLYMYIWWILFPHVYNCIFPMTLLDFLTFI